MVLNDHPHIPFSMIHTQLFLFFSSESGYDLPPDGHAYGRVFPRDPEGWSVGDGAESCFHGFFGHEFPMGFKH